MNEFVTLDLIQKSLTSGCHVVKFWTLVIGSVSQTLLGFNSSINFLLYPAISKDFRKISKEYLKSKIACLSRIWPFAVTSIPRDTVVVDEISSDSCLGTLQIATFSNGQTLESGEQQPSIILEELPTQQDIIVSCVNEKATGTNNVTLSLVSPSSSRKNELKCNTIYQLEPPVDNRSIAPSELTSFLAQEDANRPIKYYASVSQNVLME